MIAIFTFIDRYWKIALVKFYAAFLVAVVIPGERDMRETSNWRNDLLNIWLFEVWSWNWKKNSMICEISSPGDQQQLVNYRFTTSKNSIRVLVTPNRPKFLSAILHENLERILILKPHKLMLSVTRPHIVWRDVTAWPLLRGRANSNHFSYASFITDQPCPHLFPRNSGHKSSRRPVDHSNSGKSLV